MRLNRMNRLSIDELVDIYDKLLEEQDYELRDIVNIEERLVRKISRDRHSEYRFSLQRIKDSLIDHLVKYGSYLKTEYRKDDQLAEKTLIKALKFDKTNPIALYRLGFLAYKKRNYSRSVYFFESALKSHELNEKHRHALNSQQRYNASLYLCNSALYVAEFAQKSLAEIEGEVEHENSVNLELSPLYKVIARNETYLQNNAYTMISKDDQSLGSIEACEQLIQDKRSNHIILFFSDREVILYYKEQHIHLVARPAEMLKQFMLESHEKAPLKKEDFSHVFSKVKGEIKTNTYIVAINRLRNKLKQCHIPEDVLLTRERLGTDRETAYYYNHKYPFIIIQRTDFM